MKFSYLIIFLILHIDNIKPLKNKVTNIPDKNPFKINFNKFVQISLKPNLNLIQNNFLEIKEKKIISNNLLTKGILHYLLKRVNKS